MTNTYADLVLREERWYLREGLTGPRGRMAETHIAWANSRTRLAAIVAALMEHDGWEPVVCDSDGSSAILRRRVPDDETPEDRRRRAAEMLNDRAVRVLAAAVTWCSMGEADSHEARDAAMSELHKAVRAWCGRLPDETVKP